MSFKQHLFKTRLILEEKIPHTQPNSWEAEVINEVLKRHNITVHQIDTYSSKKSPELIIFEKNKYIVLDHALIEFFQLLNYLVENACPGDIVILTLQRALAEAFRNAGHLHYYAFFTRRAMDVKEAVNGLNFPKSHDSDYWPWLIILAHESAHAIPQESQLGEVLSREASTTISLEVTKLIQKLNDLTGDILNGKKSPISSVKIFEWIESIGISSQELIDAFLSKTNDSQFVSEIVCDNFANKILQNCLFGRDSQRALEAITSAHRTFLNMRFAQYIEDIAYLATQSIPEKINPLRLGGLVEFTIRGNLFANELHAALHSMPQTSSSGNTILEISEKHTNLLYEPFNEFIDTILFSENFPEMMTQSLIEDGYKLEDFDSAPFQIRRELDDMWRTLAS